LWTGRRVAAYDFCDVFGGSFTTEVFGGQTHSTPVRQPRPPLLLQQW
jgi:hypothetical protein